MVLRSLYLRLHTCILRKLNTVCLIPQKSVSTMSTHSHKLQWLIIQLKEQSREQKKLIWETNLCQTGIGKSEKYQYLLKLISGFNSTWNIWVFIYLFIFDNPTFNSIQPCLYQSKSQSLLSNLTLNYCHYFQSILWHLVWSLEEYSGQFLHLKLYLQGKHSSFVCTMAI